MAFLSQKTLQLFEQEHMHTHPRQISGSACCCQILLTHIVNHLLGQAQEPALGRSSLPTHGQTHTHSVTAEGPRAECVLESMFEQHPTAQQFQLCFFYHTKPQWSFHMPPSSLQSHTAAVCGSI